MKIDYCGIHDAICDATGKDLSNEELEVEFNNLPPEIKGLAIAWGGNDTEFGDKVYKHYKTLQIKKCNPCNHYNKRKPLLICNTGHKGVGKTLMTENLKQPYLLKEALEVLKWNFEHTQVIDSNMQSDFFNLNMNIITELENFK